MPRKYLKLTKDHPEVEEYKKDVVIETRGSTIPKHLSKYVKEVKKEDFDKYNAKKEKEADEATEPVASTVEVDENGGSVILDRPITEDHTGPNPEGTDVPSEPGVMDTKSAVKKKKG
jgi:hypothetical protein